MATYEGSQGISALKAKIKTKSKMLVGESLEKIAILLIDESPLGAPYYASKQGNIQRQGGAGGNTSGTPASGISDGTSMKIPSDKQYFNADFKRSSAEKNMSTFPFTSYEETDYDNPYYYNINSFFRSTR